MKATLILATLLGLVPMVHTADNKTLSIVGEYTLISGKKNGMGPDDDSKRAKYIIDAKTITIDAKDAKFIIGYTLNPKTTPPSIELEILQGPNGAKGEKALGIVERSGDDLKIAYSLEKDKRPKDFDGKDGMLFVFKVKGKEIEERQRTRPR